MEWVGGFLTHALVAFFLRRRSKGLLSDLSELSDEAFPVVGYRGLFSTFFDLRLRGSVCILSAVLMKERKYLPLSVVPLLPYFTVIFLSYVCSWYLPNSALKRGCLPHTLPFLRCPIDSNNIPSSAGSRTPPTTYFVSSSFLQREYNLPIVLICNPGCFSVSRRCWWKHLS